MQTISTCLSEFLKHDPALKLNKVRCPVLALYGEKDMQMPLQKNGSVIQQALQEGENAHGKQKIFAWLNHLFQPCILITQDE